jgi:hypothetical protein
MKRERKLFKEDLPTKMHRGRECVDWDNVIGCKVRFQYGDVFGVVEILECIGKDKQRLLTIQYNDKIKEIYVGDFFV